MKNIYQNLDKLEVSFCGAVPKHIRDILCAAKEEARVSENTVYVEIGEPAITVAVLKSGWGGGYRYVFDTGWDGELWGIGESDDPKLWNIRVVVRAMNLAVNGYELAKQKIYQTLEIIGAYGSNTYNAEQKTVSCELLESVARMDYCIDFDLQDFMPVADNFVAHARSKSVSNVELEETRQGNIVTGLRIGDIKRRQVAIYNKFKEIHATGKAKAWYEVWGIKPEDIQGNIWRVEIRFGKSEFEQWNIKTLEQLEQKMGDILLNAFNKARYALPSETDSNRSRWKNHPLWDECIAAIKTGLSSQCSGAVRGRIIEGFREDKINEYRNIFMSNIIPYANLLGKDISEIDEVVRGIEEDILYGLKTSPKTFSKKYNKARERFRYLTEKPAYQV